MRNSKKNNNFAGKIEQQKHLTMARPIKETPTLYGEDAIRFADAVANPRPVSMTEMAKMEAAHQRFLSMANFAF